MRIAIVTPGFSGGGAEHISISTANYYHKKGYVVTVFSFGRNGPMKHLLHEEVKLEYINPGNYFSLVAALAFRSLYFDHVLSFIRSTNISVYLARSLRRIRTPRLHLVEVNTFNQQQELNILSRIWQDFLLRLAYNSTEDLIAVSSLVRDQIIHKYGACRVRVLGNPCLGDNQLNQDRDCLPVIKRDRRFVAAGRLHPQKDFHTMIRAFVRYVRSCRVKDTLTIFGEGAQRNELIDMITDLGAEEFIFMPGFSDNLYLEFRKYDVFLMTSIYEGFGNVIILAMASGMPVIARRNTGGPDDLVNSTTGVLFDDEDHLVKLLKTTDYKEFSSSRIANFASFYSISNICELYLDGYRG